VHPFRLIAALKKKPTSGSHPDPAFPSLVADVGGTNARFGWVPAAGAPVQLVRTLPVPGHAGPLQAAQAYLAQIAPVLGDAYTAPHSAAIAVATAVGSDRIELTNSHWDFSRSQLQRELGLRALLMLNDFEALALSLPRLQPAQLRAHGALPQPAGTLAV